MFSKNSVSREAMFFAARETLDTLPDVMWRMEYPDEAGRQRSLKTRLESPEFKRCGKR